MAQFVREAAMTGVIFGFFGMTWFGWAQEAPPKRARLALAAGSVASIALAIFAGVLSWRHWNDGSAINAETGPRFGVVVAIEILAAGVGAVVLSARRRPDLTAPWVAFVVGVHFIPLAVLLEYPLLYVAAALVALGAVASVPIAAWRKLTVSYVTGAMTGTALLICGTISVALALA
ncbi:MAG TPA: hypothetical protein VF062_15595 [Candidatus Limnocylindrales bacterium]